MDSEELISEGLALLVMGMGFVFFFLVVLVVTMVTMSALIQKFLPTPATKTAATPADGALSPQIVAAISAAIHIHRSNRSN